MSATWAPSSFLPRGPSRTMAIVGAIAAMLILAFLGVVVLAEGGGGGGSPSGTAVTSATAERLAAAGLGSGSWQLILAEGIDPWNSTTVSTNTSSTLPNCTLSYTPPVAPTTIVYPAYRGDLSAGLAVIWILGYVQPATHTAGFALIINGAAQAVIRVSGANCPLYPPTSNFTALPPNAIDSSAAAQAIDQAGGTQYLASNRNYVSLTMILVDVRSLSAAPVPYWDFEFDPCGGSPFSGNSTGPANGTGFGGTVYATNGTVVQAAPIPDECGPGRVPPPNPGVFPFMPGIIQLVRENRTGATLATQGCTRGDYCYELPMDRTYENDTPADFELRVTNSTGAPDPAVVGYAILDPHGTVLVYSIGSEETTWTPASGAPTTPLETGDALWVDMGSSDPSGLGYSLYAQGLGAFGSSTTEFGLF